MSPRNLCELHVGRLIELRIDAGYRDIADVDAIFAAVYAAAARIPSGQRWVIAADWSRCRVVAEGAAEKLVAGFRGLNPHIERSAALLPGGSVALLQSLRMLRESNNPDRRGFSDAGAMIAWLSEVLTPEEVARLHTFLA
jgi:hypothetical protein